MTGQSNRVECAECGSTSFRAQVLGTQSVQFVATGNGGEVRVVDGQFVNVTGTLPNPVCSRCGTELEQSIENEVEKETL